MVTEVNLNSEKDDFSAAFAQFNAVNDQTLDTKLELTEIDQNNNVELDKNVAIESTTSNSENTAEETTKEAVEEAAEEAEEEATEETTADDEELLRKLAALVKKSAGSDEDTSKPEETQPQEQSIYSEEEQTFINEYTKDWPDIAKAEALIRRAEYRDLVNYVFEQVAKEFVPLKTNLQTLLERVHLEDIESKVENYSEVRDKVINWVETQPKYLQNAYKQVIQQGTPDEIADLVERYKREAGLTNTSKSGFKEASELPSTAKQAAASLAPVRSKRSTIVQTDDPNDFDGAFSEFAKTLT